MSYSGYTEFLCENGHLLARDCRDDDPKECHLCASRIAWFHSVDTTNGSAPDEPWTIAAPIRKIAEDDVWHTDHHGNQYATKLRRYAPNSREWRRVRLPASGTEARQRQDPQGLDPKGDGPTSEAGDAQ